SSFLVASNSAGSVFSNGVALSSSIDWSAASHRFISVNFSTASTAAFGVYMQSMTSSGTDYLTPSITGTPTLQTHDDTTVTGQYPATVAGRMTGVAGVASTGAGTYAIPLDLPGGINQMTPRLSLVYSSTAAPGFFGPGWTLSGLSAITRCNSTKAQNGTAAN